CFVTVLRARRDSRPAWPVRPWVFTIAARIRLDALRRRHRRREDAGAEEIENIGDTAAADGHDPEADAERAALTEAVRAAMDRLPPAQRIAIPLHPIDIAP